MEEIISVFGVNWKLLVIQIVNFAVLILILWRFLYRPLLRVIEKRREKILHGLQTAEKAERKLKEVQSEESLRIAGALQKGEEIVRQARGEAKKREKEILQEAHHKEEKIVRNAKERAMNEKEKILSTAQEEIARRAVLAAEKILQGKPSVIGKAGPGHAV